jgi:prephenate dehydratase
VLDITHNLLVLPGTTMEQVKKIYSHPQALAQCERFLRSSPACRSKRHARAGSAKLVKEKGLKDAAAIASERAAQVFGLEILKPEIQDFSDNITRFLVVSRRPTRTCRPTRPPWSSRCRTSRDRCSRRCRSRAARDRPHQDRVASDPRASVGMPFYVDLPVGRHDLRCARALVHLAEFARSMRTLGSYPSWKGRDAAQQAS